MPSQKTDNIYKLNPDTYERFKQTGLLTSQEDPDSIGLDDIKTAKDLPEAMAIFAWLTLNDSYGGILHAKTASRKMLVLRGSGGIPYHGGWLEVIDVPYLTDRPEDLKKITVDHEIYKGQEFPWMDKKNPTELRLACLLMLEHLVDHRDVLMPPESHTRTHVARTLKMIPKPSNLFSPQELHPASFRNRIEEPLQRLEIRWAEIYNTFTPAAPAPSTPRPGQKR